MVWDFLASARFFREYLVVFRLDSFAIEHFGYFPKGLSFVDVEPENTFHEFRFFLIHKEFFSS